MRSCRNSFRARRRSWETRPNPEVSVRQPADPQEMARTLEFVRDIIAESLRLAAKMGIERS